MRREMQITLDNDANHRALRRCYGCGSYARPYDEVNGAIRCERCAHKTRRGRDDEDENLNNRPANVVV
jgi:rRNA maturation endonuclease Nob1